MRAVRATVVRTLPEIVIIDDDPQMRRLLVRLLKGDGHTVHEATNGGEGVQLFRRVHPVLVITDILMPDQEGIETIQQLRRENPTIPILAISGGGPPVYLRAAIGLGASAALEKPFGADEFLSVVRKLIETN
jgi:CheY-like chemotaxis protein